MTSTAIRVQKQSVAITYMVGIASLFICCAWLVQATTFTGDASATVLWTLLAAMVAGVGAALVYVARCWLKAE